MAPSKDNSAGDPPEAAGRHERFHKAYFGEAVAVRDALVGLVPLLQSDAAPQVDFNTLERMPTGMIDKASRSRFTDRPWRVRPRDTDGTAYWLHIVVMLKFQAAADWFTVSRMEGYAARPYECMRVGRAPNGKS